MPKTSQMRQMSQDRIYFDEASLKTAACAQARSEALKEALKEALIALAVGAIMSSPLWAQALFCLLAGECA